MNGAVPEPALAEWRTSLIGRDRDIAAVSRLLTSAGVTLVTLTGPGGIGKTRLAYRVLDEVRSSFPGGVTVASLSAIHDPGLVLHTIVRSFDLNMGGDVNDLQRLAVALGDERHLLVIDSFEHMTGEAPIVSMLLAACRSLTILVTSRAALRLSVEREYPVGPLVLVTNRDGLTLDIVATSSAVELFVQRARAVKPDFALTADNAATIAEIVARLDGLPLAIELAAVRSKVLAPRALLARLSHRLSLLTGGARDMPERLRTMRDAIAWSHGLLDEEEQALFRRLAVFDGSFSLEAAETIAGGENGMFVLDGISSLVDKSLLVHELSAEGESRYRLLETIREYAIEQLGESDEEPGVRARQIEWAIELAETARGHLYGSADQPVWMQRLTTERDTIRGALAWAFASGDIVQGGCLAGTLWGYWFSTDNVLEGSNWLERALVHIDQLPDGTREQVLCGVGFLALIRLEFKHAQANLERVLTLATANKNVAYIGWAQFGLGIIAQDTGDPATAQRHFEAARDAFAGVPNRPALYATATQNLGLVISRQGDHVRGAAMIEESLATFKRLGFELGAVIASRFLGQVMRAKGDDERAVTLLLESLQVKRNITQQWHIANAMEALASIAANHRQEELAATLFGAIDAFRIQAAAPLEPALQPEHHQILEKLRQSLGDAVFEQAWTTGRAMPIEQAISEAAAISAVGPVVRPTSAAENAGLTPREIDVLKLLVDGKSTGDIAEMLFISPRTVSTHVASILGKLGVPTRSAAVASALRGKLV